MVYGSGDRAGTTSRGSATGPGQRTPASRDRRPSVPCELMGRRVIASYSSQGPTNDERVKPDLSRGVQLLERQLPEATVLQRHSAATPVVAGAAAVMLSANPAATPAQLVDALKAAVTDRGNPGPDNVFGTGEHPSPATRASAAAASAGVVAGREVGGGRPDPAQPQVEISRPGAVEGGRGASIRERLAVGEQGDDFTEGAAVGSKKRVRIKMTLAKSNQYAIRSFDAAGAPGVRGTTRGSTTPASSTTRTQDQVRAGLASCATTRRGSTPSLPRRKSRVRASAVQGVVDLAGDVPRRTPGRSRSTSTAKRSERSTSGPTGCSPSASWRTCTTEAGHAPVIELEPLTTGGRGVVFLDGFLVLG